MITRIAAGIMLVFLFLGCEKDEKPDLIKTPQDLLTQNTWTLNAVGFDDNQNGRLDEEENILEICQADNSYIFFPGGNGTFMENAISCGTSDHDFSWKFMENESILEIEMEPYSIFHLDESELIISPDLPWLAADFVMILKH